MRTRTRLVTTAGVTVLGFTAMSGMAQADTGGLGLSDLTSPVTKTLGGVVKQVVPASSRGTRDSGPALNLPVHLHVKVPPTSRTDTTSRGVRTQAARTGGSLATADVDATVSTSQVRANVGLCASLTEECGTQPPPPPTPNPPSQPPPGRPPQQPGGKAPTATGSFTAIGNDRSLPFTGGPIGSLAFLGVISVLTGAAGVGASRIRVRRQS